jgi:hypothetical protein
MMSVVGAIQSRWPVVFGCFGFVNGGVWLLDQFLTDGLGKTLAVGAIVIVAVTLATTLKSSTQLSESSRAEVGRPFRILAWLLGPLGILSGLIGASAAVMALRSGSALSEIVYLGTIALLSVVVGILLIQAARTGRDPLS